jgi:hypothetical protein
MRPRVDFRWFIVSTCLLPSMKILWNKNKKVKLKEKIVFVFEWKFSFKIFRKATSIEVSSDWQIWFAWKLSTQKKEEKPIHYCHITLFSQKFRMEEDDLTEEQSNALARFQVKLFN